MGVSYNIFFHKHTYYRWNAVCGESRTYGVDLHEILERIVRDGEDPILEAPTDGLKELPVAELISADVKYLVLGLNEEGKEVQKVATLAEVKTFIDDKYTVIFNANAIQVEDEKISITGSILNTEDWNKVKENGDKTIPYRITVLNSDKTKKIAKIAMYQDGLAVIESL